MLRTSIKILYLIAATLLFPGSLSWKTVSAPEARRPDVNPYDSIRTDLSSYIWPMTTSTTMTSSFGEYRSTHFHAGIDISTGDTIGLPVMASREGYIRRITISPTGYGKIIHIRHADGFTTSYAHLQGFPPWIEAIVQKEQLRKGYYPVDITFPPDSLPVTTGQIVAFAGDTGSGSAHLHFEIRDEFNNTINPLLADPFSIVDGLPPIFRALVFTPIDSSGQVNNVPAPRVIKARQVSATRYVLDESPVLDGRIGIAVDARDRSDFSNYLHGYYTLQLVVDSTELFSVRYDRVPLRDGHQIRLVYLQQPEIKQRGRFHKLFVDTHHQLPIFSGSAPGNGILFAPGLSEGRHTFTVICVDYNGNTSELAGTFQCRRNEPHTKGMSRTQTPFDSGPRTHRIDPSGAGEIILDRGAMIIRYPRSSFFSTVDLSATPLQEAGATGYGIEPTGTPLDGGLDFLVKQPSKMNHAGIYTRSGTSWTFLSRANPDSAGYVPARLRRFLGDIALMQDSIPPTIYRVRISGTDRQPLISFRFRDNLSGVEYKEVKLYIDATMIIPEIDGEHHRATAQPTSPLSRGSHRLSIRLADKMGNSVLYERAFRVR